MSIIPVYRDKDYRLILVMPHSGHRDGEDSATYYLLGVAGMGVAYGLVKNMRRFKREVRLALNRRRITIERRHVGTQSASSFWLDVWQAGAWDLLERLEAEAIYQRNPLQAPHSLDGWTDQPLPGIDAPGKRAPVRACKILAWSVGEAGRGEVAVVGYREILPIRSAYLYKTPGRHGKATPFSELELFALPRRRDWLSQHAA